MTSEMASLHERYGFTHHPFYDERAMQNPYLSFPRHQQLLYLHHLLSFSPYFIALVGEPESGKTTFIHQFLNEARTRANFDFHAFSGTDFSSKLMLLTTLSKILRLETHGNPADVEQIRAHMANSSATKPIVLVIDDAQQCPLEVLETLMEIHLCAENDQKLKFLLIGNPALNTQIEAIKEQLPEVPSFYLLPFENFNYHETLGYIKHHFQLAGVKDYGGIPRAAIRKISKESQGQPKKINDIVIKGLLAKDAFQLPKTQRMEWPSLQTTSYTLSAIAIVLMLIVIVQNGSLGNSGVIEAEPTAQPSKLDNKPQVSVSKEAKEKKVERAPLFSDAPLIPDSLLAERTMKQPTVVNKESTASVKPMPQPNPEPVRRVEPPKPLPQMVESEPQAIRLAAFNEPVSVTQDIPDLMNVDPNHFGIQLFGAWELNKARLFQKEQLSQVPLVAFVVETRRDERPWYILIAGEFGTFSDAKTASNSLPKSVQNQQPWIRKYASIQASAVKTHPVNTP